jgi:leucyl aminopeptidase
VDIQAVAAAKADAQAYVVAVDHERKTPSLRRLGLDGAADAVLSNKSIPLPFKTVRCLPTPKGWLVLVGIGDPKKLTQEKVGTAVNLGARAAQGLGCRSVATTLAIDCKLPKTLALQAVVHGAVIGALDFDQYKTKKEPAEPKVAVEQLQVVLPPGSAAAHRKVLARAHTTALAVNDARLLANTPANMATPAWLADQARARGREHGFAVTVMDRKQLRKEGYNALCGVGQGSANEERLIVMDYHPKGAKKTLAVVGKGVCFDSGGISLKPGDKMWEMKYDKCGACATLALMGALKALGVKHRVVGIVPAVENMPGPTAQRPGDIVTAKDGTTIEVLNTDAEGRLILADAITHARGFKPDWIIDLATLTGACEIAVGPTHVAVMSNDDAFARKVVAGARAAGDKAWHLPQGEEFDEANKGTYADLQNISLTIRAGTSIGGSFLKHFAKDTKWAHLDIASKAWTAGMDYYGKGPTGAGLRIVLQRILEE